MNPPDEQKLERLIHATLRELPPQRAPDSLAARVLAELARRAALPWWRQSFVHWPLPARAVFVVASAAFAKVGIMAAVWAMAGFDGTAFREAFSTQFAWVRAAASVGNAFGDFCTVMLHSIPPLWLYGAAAVVGALYFTLFGLGTFAYRTLYANR